jgi:hypothetical protein
MQSTCHSRFFFCPSSIWLVVDVWEFAQVDDVILNRLAGHLAPKFKLKEMIVLSENSFVSLFVVV